MKTFPVDFEIVRGGEPDLYGSSERVVAETLTLHGTSAVTVSTAEQSGNTITDRQITRLFVTSDLDDLVTVGDRFVLNGSKYEIAEVVNFPKTWFAKPSWFGSYVDGVATGEVFDAS